MTHACRVARPALQIARAASFEAIDGDANRVQQQAADELDHIGRPFRWSPQLMIRQMRVEFECSA